MKDVIDWLTRKRLLIVSTILALPWFAFGTHMLYRLYDKYLIVSTLLDYYRLVFWFILPVLVFSAFFLLIESERVFRLWKASLLCFLIVYIAILWRVPWFDHDQFFHLIDKSNVAKALAFFYSIFSLIFITVLALKDRKPKPLKK